MFHNAVVKPFIPTAYQYTAYNWHTSGVMSVGNIVIVEITHFDQHLMLTVNTSDAIEWMGRKFFCITFRKRNQQPDVTKASAFLRNVDAFFREFARRDLNDFYQNYMPQLISDAVNNTSNTKDLKGAKTIMQHAVVSNDLHTRIEIDLNASEPMRKRVKAN
jgi:hypothetical protein